MHLYSLSAKHMAVASVTSAAMFGTDAGASIALNFEETQFAPSSWTDYQSSFGGSGSGSSFVQQAGQGLSGNALQVANVLRQGPSGLQSVVLFSGATWVNGVPITGLEMSVSAKGVSVAAQLYGFALEQGGLIWTTSGVSWTTEVGSFSTRISALSAANFVRSLGSDPASQPDNPDFGAGAAPITFGFFVANSSPSGSLSRSTEALYSNFSVTVVPAPGCLFLVAFAGVSRRSRMRGAPLRRLK
jgi:hypothetical protein